MINNDPYKLEYTKFKLNNGIKCVIYPRNELHSVTIQVNVNVGSLDETDNTNGLSHFIEHVCHDGTEEFKKWDDVDDFVSNISGSTNAYTSITHTQYYGTFPHQYIEKALKYFSQIVLHPTFPESEVEKERDIILDEMKGYQDEIDYKVMRNIKDNRFKNSKTSFSSEIIGTQKLIEKYTKEDLVSFHSEFYIPKNIEIYIVGNVNINQAKKFLERFFDIQRPNKFNFSQNRSFKTEFPDYSNTNVSTQQKLDIDQYYLTFNFPSLEFSSSSIEDRIKLNFLQSITASSSYFQSVLWKRLRQELGIVYGVQAWNYDMFSRSIFTIQTSFKKEYLETVLKEFTEGITKIKEGKIDNTVFNTKKKKIRDTQLMQMDKPSNVINWIADYEEEVEEHGRAFSIQEYLNFVETLELNEIIEVAQRIYNFEHLNIGVVSKDNSPFVKNMVEQVMKF